MTYEEEELERHINICKALAESKAARDQLEKLMESPVEREFLQILARIYDVTDIKAQVNYGAFRVDFETPDRIAWEVDGAKFHDLNRDCRRDRQICEMPNGPLAVVRIPASILMFNPRATSRIVEHIAGVDCDDSWGPVRPSFVDHMLNECYEDLVLANEEPDATWFTETECYDFEPTRRRFRVGKASSFVDNESWIWRHIPKKEHGLCQWQEFIRVGTFRQMHRMSPLKRHEKRFSKSTLFDTPFNLSLVLAINEHFNRSPEVEMKGIAL